MMGDKRLGSGSAQQAGEMLLQDDGDDKQLAMGRSCAGVDGKLDRCGRKVLAWLSYAAGNAFAGATGRSATRAPRPGRSLYKNRNNAQPLLTFLPASRCCILHPLRLGRDAGVSSSALGTLRAEGGAHLPDSPAAGAPTRQPRWARACASRPPSR